MCTDSRMRVVEFPPRSSACIVSAADMVSVRERLYIACCIVAAHIERR